MRRGGNRQQNWMSTYSMWGFTRALTRSDYFITSALVICSDGLFERRVLNDTKAPMLHVAAARAAHTRLQNLPDQRFWHQVRFQSPHRAGRLDNFEQIGGARQLLDHGFLLTLTPPAAQHPASLLPSISPVGVPLSFV